MEEEHFINVMGKWFLENGIKTNLSKRFELDENKPADNQIRKTVFNLEAGEVTVNNHFKEGQVFKKPKIYNRQELISQGKSGDMNEKEAEESKE